MTPRNQIVLLFAMVLLAGCGEVIVFGHVVREGNKSTATTVPATQSASNSSETGANTKVATSSAAPATNTNPTSDVATAPATTTAPKATSTPVPAVTAQTTVTAASPVSKPVTAPTVQQVKQVTLMIAPELAAKVATDSRFDKAALLAAIKAELQTRKILQGNDSQPGTTLQVYVDHYDLHANTNFVIFGATPNTGTLAGLLSFKDQQDDAFPNFHVEAHARVSIPEDKKPKDLLEPLYREFAITVADSITGQHSKHDDDDQTGR